MFMFRSGILVALCLLLALSAFAAQPSVRLVCFTPKGIAPPTQEFIEKEIIDGMIEVQQYYADEVKKHNQESKKFKLERKNNQVVIHKIKGKRYLKEYYNLRVQNDFDKIVKEIDKELGNGFSEGGGEIRVIFMIGMEFMTDESHATHLSRPIDRHYLKHYCFIAADSEKLPYITAHEIGHAFELEHNPKSKKYLMYKDAKRESLEDVRLSKDETRWLYCFSFFNDENNIKSKPTVDVSYISKWFLRRLYTKLQFDIENKYPIHQAYLVRQKSPEEEGNYRVLGYDYMSKDKYTATFYVRTSYLRKFNDIRLKLLDTYGNYVFHDIDFLDLYTDLYGHRAAPSLFVPQTVGTWGEIKANR